MCLVFVEFEVKNDHNFCVHHSADIAQLILPHMYIYILYAFLCKYFVSMLILCNMFVKVELI